MQGLVPTFTKARGQSGLTGGRYGYDTGEATLIKEI
jgi:hypothetical protein